MSEELLPPKFRFEHGENFIQFNDCKSGSIEVKVPRHHVYQVPSMFFEWMKYAYDLDSILLWLSNMDSDEIRWRAIKALEKAADGIEMEGEIYG